MSSSSGAPVVSQELQTKFKSIVDAQPKLNEAEIKTRLATAPAADIQAYYHWVLQYRASQGKDRLKVAPPDNRAVKDLVSKTKFDDAVATYELAAKINGPVGLAPFTLGSYTAGGEKIFLIIDFHDDMLPLDVEPDSSVPPTNLTEVVSEPSSRLLPERFFQLGQLFRAPSASTPFKDATATPWAVVVTPSRQVSALFNPVGSDMNSVPASNMDPEAYKERDTAGQFPGFTQPGTLMPLSTDIDRLLNVDTAPDARTLTLRDSDLVALPTGTTLKFRQQSPAGVESARPQDESA